MQRPTHRIDIEPEDPGEPGYRQMLTGRIDDLTARLARLEAIVAGIREELP